MLVLAREVRALECSDRCKLFDIEVYCHCHVVFSVFLLLSVQFGVTVTFS